MFFTSLEKSILPSGGIAPPPLDETTRYY